ncbi:MAG: DUF975 family protein [Oscillospiraceae bacterium]|nr:DUF975 family protein [Oscillospiraceae bacterium]
MTIPNHSELKQRAREAVNACPAQRRIAAVYTAGLVGLSILVSAADFLLERMISGTGGLGNLGTQAILSTLQSMLPIVQMLLLLGWNTGYFMTVLKIARGIPADPDTLKGGFSLFFPVLRTMLLEGMFYTGITMFAFNAASLIYMFTPWANDLMTLAEPLLPGILSASPPVLEEAQVMLLMEVMIPLLIIFAVLYAALSIPVSYRLRMSTYCLIDMPRPGALRAIGTSVRLMRGNCRNLFKLDLSFWWYHGVLLLASLVQMLPLLGLPLPLSFDGQYYLFYGINLLMTAAVYLLARNRVETAYAAAYDAIREKPKENTVVLGNIFDM